MTSPINASPELDPPELDPLAREILCELIDGDAYAAADGIVDQVMAVIALEDLPQVDLPDQLTRQPANQNARRIYTFAAAAVAVAAGLFLWSRSSVLSEVAVQSRPTPRAALVAQATATIAAVAEEAEVSQAEGVEIASVDFGRLSGSVFYLDNDNNAAATTAVVWLTDLEN